MKKVLSLFVLLFLFGCALNNSPTSKVEELLNKYQMLDEDIRNEINTITDKENLTDNQKERYKKIIESQYKNLSYEIKDEKIDGDKATVTVQIKVKDYKKVIKELDEEYKGSEYTLEEYNDSKLDKLEGAKDTVIYTLELNVYKSGDEWKVDSLSNIDKKKLQGMY